MIVLTLCYLIIFIATPSYALSQSSYPAAPFDIKLANTSVWLSATAACGYKAYPTHTFCGAASGFEYVYTIYDKDTDTEGYIGIHNENKQIWVVYRGTESTTNWLDDAHVLLVSAGYKGCSDCKLHKGFKECADNTQEFLLASIKTLVAKYPTYNIITTGHSLGGSVSNIAAVTLYLNGYTNVYHYSFGSPRVGNEAWSNYCSEVLVNNPYRITHYKDMVPHIPYESMGYVHIINEVWEDYNHVLHSCIGPDDDTCAEQFSFYQTSPDDHTLYLDLPMYCANVTCSR